jgi:hypothetical protein
MEWALLNIGVGSGSTLFSVKTMIAIRRRAEMNVDLNNGWDYWPVMGEQVEELRYNILPIEAFQPTESLVFSFRDERDGKDDSHLKRGWNTFTC